MALREGDHVPRFSKTILTTGVPFGAVMALFFGLQHGPAVGLVAGLATGALFGALLAAFVVAQARRMKIAGDALDGEPILLQGPANHWRGAEARGGWLVLTTRRLVFRSHGKNIQNQGLDLQLTDVTAVEPSRSLGLIPNGLRVRLAGEVVERFVVSERDAWLAAVADARARG